MICRRCNEDLPPEMMRKNRGRPTSTCKRCEAARVKAYYDANPEKRKEISARNNAKMRANGYTKRWIEEKKKDPEWVARNRERERERRRRAGARVRDETPLTPEGAIFLVKRYSRSLMRRAIEKGVLVRQPCEVCGDPKSDGHHDDYLQPLKVRWLCPQHHIETHWNDPQWVQERQSRV